MLRAVEVRTEAHAFIGNLSQFRQAENLVAAGIGENRAVPRHELMKATQLPDQCVAWPQIQMISVGKDDLRAECFERFLCQALYGGRSAYGHEHRRFHHSVRRLQLPAARTGWIIL